MVAVFVILGVILWSVGFIWLLYEAFKVHIAWFIAGLIVPLVVVVFGVKHLGKAKKPLILYVGGFVVWLIGVLIANVA